MIVQEPLEIYHNPYQESPDRDALTTFCPLGKIRTPLNDKISGGQRQRSLPSLSLGNHPDLIFPGWTF